MRRNAIPEIHLLNPNAVIHQVPIPGHLPCLVVDDFLLEPERMVAWAGGERAAFAHEGGNYFPGPEVNMPSDVTASLAQFFMLHVRRMLGARRTLETTCRLSMVTKAPSQLMPLQRICHRDIMVGRRKVNPDSEGIAACVLYLFKDSALGGTSFYTPSKPPQQIEALIRRAMTATSAEFAEILGAAPGYMNASNAYFEQVCHIPAAFNRAIFYDGSIFHSAQITAPDRLSLDPETGRLTLNGFFLFRQSAS